LQEKAAFRNPNEFYYKMINSKTVDGVHRPKTAGKKHTEEKLMKMQDISHLMSKWQAEKKKVERLQSSFVLSVKVKYQVCRSILLKRE
jgi:U3 small nucleolar RNA-associated protein 11